MYILRSIFLLVGCSMIMQLQSSDVPPKTWIDLDNVVFDAETEETRFITNPKTGAYEIINIQNIQDIPVRIEIFFETPFYGRPQYGIISNDSVFLINGKQYFLLNVEEIVGLVKSWIEKHRHNVLLKGYDIDNVMIKVGNATIFNTTGPKEVQRERSKHYYIPFSLVKETERINKLYVYVILSQKNVQFYEQ